MFSCLVWNKLFVKKTEKALVTSPKQISLSWTVDAIFERLRKFSKGCWKPSLLLGVFLLKKKKEEEESFASGAISKWFWLQNGARSEDSERRNTRKQ